MPRNKSEKHGLPTRFPLPGTPLSLMAADPRWLERLFMNQATGQPRPQHDHPLAVAGRNRYMDLRALFNVHEDIAYMRWRNTMAVIDLNHLCRLWWERHLDPLRIKETHGHQHQLRP